MREDATGFVAILGTDRRLEYATYLGGTGQERIWAIDADAAGNVYVAGDTGSADYPVTPGAYDTTFNRAGILDVFVAKISAAGGLAYSTLLGGTEVELPSGIAVDASGRAHVVGYSSSPDFPNTPGAVSGYHQRDDAFHARVNATGTALSYSTLVGGAGSERAVGVGFDSAGAAYIGGETESSDLPATAAFQPASGGSTDAWLMKIGTDGALST